MTFDVRRGTTAYHRHGGFGDVDVSYDTSLRRHSRFQFWRGAMGLTGGAGGVKRMARRMAIAISLPEELLPRSCRWLR